jgi:hypothetical protein
MPGRSKKGIKTSYIRMQTRFSSVVPDRMAKDKEFLSNLSPENDK